VTRPSCMKLKSCSFAESVCFMHFCCTRSSNGSLEGAASRTLEMPVEWMVLSHSDEWALWRANLRPATCGLWHSGSPTKKLHHFRICAYAASDRFHHAARMHSCMTSIPFKRPCNPGHLRALRCACVRSSVRFEVRTARGHSAYRS
jgi:hypothetical protein